jgi:hypothetical protein
MTTMSVLSAPRDAGAGIKVGWVGLEVLGSSRKSFVIIVANNP